MFSFLRNAFLSLSLVATSVVPSHAAGMTGGDGQYFYRYKTAMDAAYVPPEPEMKDITAFYVGGIGYEFSERLPMKPEWADDRWKIVKGSLPRGLAFDARTLTFEGTPETEASAVVVELAGYDTQGLEVATAVASFEVITVKGAPIKVDIYNHTGKYKVDELAIPSNITVHEWKNLYSPPTGVAINGPFIEGTPTKAGTTRVFGQGLNYKGEVVVTYFGNYLVEDGPSFPSIADMVYPLPQVDRTWGLRFDFGAPSSFRVNRQIDPARQPRYFVELDSGEKYPLGVTSNDNYKNLLISGWVTQPYDTARIRFRALDVDGISGVSNWFTFGSSDPQPTCNRNVTSENAIRLYTGRHNQFPIPLPDGKQGVLSYHLISGQLPNGMTLNSTDGLVSGTPTTVGDDQDFTVRIDVTNGSSTVSTECAYRVEVASQGVKIVDATDAQARHVRVGDTFNGVATVVGGISPYSLAFTTPSDWPTMAFTTPTTDTATVGLTGQFSTAGGRTVPLTLTNGDGHATPGSIGFVVHDELDIGTIDTIHVKRYAASQTWATIPYDQATVIPEVANWGKYPVFTLQNASGLPANIALSGDSLVGATAAEAKTYGPFKVEIADYSGDRKMSNEFMVVVDPRDEIKGKDPVEPIFTADWDRDVTAPPVFEVIQPPGAKHLDVEYTLTGPSFDWLQFDTDTGEMKALAGIPREDIGRQGPFTITAKDTEGSTVTSKEFYVNVRDWPEPTGTVPAFKATADGDTSKGEDGTKVNVLNLLARVDEYTVIGGRSAVTFLAAEPPVGGIVFDPAAGSLIGVPTEEFDGSIRVTFKDGRDRVGFMDVPLEVRGYPRVSVSAPQFELPRLSDAAGLVTPITGQTISGFWNLPVWDWADGVAKPEGLSVNPNSGRITGRTSLPVNAVIPDLKLKATSRAPTGETLVSETGTFSIKVTAAVPMTLSYAPTKATYRLKDLGNGRYSFVSADLVSPTVGGSAVAPLTYKLDQAQAQSEGLKGIDITPIGTLQGSPDRLGEWTVFADVADKEGNKPVGGQVELTIKATLAGNIEAKNGGGAKALRQEEPFKTDDLQVSNYVGSVRFLTSPALLPEKLDFSATTGAFSDQSYFEVPTETSLYVMAKDDDERTFAAPLKYDFKVVPPLEITSLPQVSIHSKQYSAKAGDPIDVTFTPSVKNVIGKIAYGLEGELPGQLVSAVVGENGGIKSYVWTTEANEYHELELDPTGKVERYMVNRADQPLPYTAASDYFPLDALVFHPKNLTLKGIPSKAGTFGDIRLVAYDDHTKEYIRDVATKAGYNTAKSPEIVITVDPADPLLAVNMVGTAESDTETLSRYTTLATLRTEAKNAAYGRGVSWNRVSGTLPQNVVASTGQTVVYSGYPENTGTFPDIVYRVKDAADRAVNANPVTFVVGPRQPFELVASANPAGFKVNEPVTPLLVSPVNTAYNRAIPDSDWTVTGVTNLPPGITATVAGGKVTFDGTPTVVGKYENITVSAVDALGAAASVTLTMNVILPTDAIVLNVSNIRTKVGYDFEMQATASNTYGKVRFYSNDIAGALASKMSINGSTGLVTGNFDATGDHDVDIYVTDTTNRVTSKPVQIAVIPDLRITVPQIVSATQAEPLKRPIATDYVIGTAKYAKGAGDWPVGIDVNPDTGEIVAVDTSSGSPVNNVISKTGDYTGLTIIGTDTFGNGLVDQQSSNAFTIRVNPIQASPVISDITNNRMVFGTVGTAATPFTPTVKDSVKGKPWNYAGTKYSLNRTLPAGLEFDQDTGTISGTPTEPVIIRDLKIKVTAQNGDSSETAAFWFGVAPSGDITAQVDQRRFLRKGDALVTDAPSFDNTLGNLTYAKTSGNATIGVNATTGSLWAAGATSGWVAQDYPIGVAVTDEFNRKGNTILTLVVAEAVSLSASNKYVYAGETAGLQLFTVTNVIGTATATVTGLPPYLSFNPVDYTVGGTVPQEDAGKKFTVNISINDSHDGDSTSASLVLNVIVKGKDCIAPIASADPMAKTNWSLHMWGNVAGNRLVGGNGQGAVRVAEVKFFDADGNCYKPVSTTDYYSAATSKNFADGDPLTYHRSNTGGGSVQYFGVPVMFTHAVITMTGSSEDLAITDVCRGNNGGWSYSGYFQQCGVTKQALTTLNGTPYAPLQQVMYVFPAFTSNPSPVIQSPY